MGPEVHVPPPGLNSSRLDDRLERSDVCDTRVSCAVFPSSSLKKSSAELKRILTNGQVSRSFDFTSISAFVSTDGIHTLLFCWLVSFFHADCGLVVQSVYLVVVSSLQEICGCRGSSLLQSRVSFIKHSFPSSNTHTHTHIHLSGR